jgi:hypothetical protein
MGGGEVEDQLKPRRIISVTAVGVDRTIERCLAHPVHGRRRKVEANGFRVRCEKNPTSSPYQPHVP